MNPRGTGSMWHSFLKIVPGLLTDDGPCLGSRKPNQPYEWQSYSEVRGVKSRGRLLLKAFLQCSNIINVMSIMAAVVVTVVPTIETFDVVQTQVVSRAEHIGSALLHKGHTPDGDKHIGIFSQNRPEVRLTLCFPPTSVLCHCPFIALLFISLLSF